MNDQVSGSSLNWGSPLDGLPLVRPTSERWATVALSDLDALLCDHAHCEQKAASMALSMIGRFAEQQPLIRPLIALAQEETHHFRQVVDLIEQRGGALTRPKSDRYVGRLRDAGFTSEGGLGALGDLLLVCGLIEARSCERFRLLADALSQHVEGLEDADRDQLETFTGA